jgi:molybdate/tungstate transport system substrate-binding protein
VSPASEVQQKASYTLTILGDAQNPKGAERFVEFLLSQKGRELLAEHGVGVVKLKVAGDAQSLPVSLRTMIEAGQ